MDFVFYDRNFAYFLPINSNSYYTYHGSLTTPPYSEAVTWIVFTQTMPISGYQVSSSSFRIFLSYGRFFFLVLSSLSHFFFDICPELLYFQYFSGLYSVLRFYPLFEEFNFFNEEFNLNNEEFIFFTCIS